MQTNFPLIFIFHFFQSTIQDLFDVNVQENDPTKRMSEVLDKSKPSEEVSVFKIIYITFTFFTLFAAKQRGLLVCPCVHRNYVNTTSHNWVIGYSPNFYHKYGTQNFTLIKNFEVKIKG